MKKIKSLTLIVLLGLSFTLMSFSSKSDDLLGDAYLIQYETSENYQVAEAANLAALGRLAIAATRRAVVFTAEVVRVALPGIDQAVIQASTVLIADNVDKHTNNYVRSFQIVKDQKTRKLG